MDRRALIKLAAGASLLSLPLTSKLARASGRGAARFVFIGNQNTASAQNFLLQVSDHINRLDNHWTRNLETLDTVNDVTQIAWLMDQYGPNTENVEWPIILRIPAMFNGEVEVWNLDWLSELEDGIVDACYPVSGGWWSVDGDWNPNITKVRNHLFHSPNHTEGHFTAEWLDLLSRSELQSIHSDHHREMTNAGKVHWTHVNQECPAS